MSASKRVYFIFLLWIVGSMSLGCSDSKTKQKSFPACDKYVAQVCELCGPKTSACSAITHRMTRCTKTGKCLESICIDSMNATATEDKAGLKKMLCSGTQ
jgi:hypothetical protein